MTAAIASLVFGIIVGYLGQRSRLCFIAGYRDWFVMRDTFILKGVIGAFIGAVGGYILFKYLGGIVPMFPMLLNSPGVTMRSVWMFTIVGGIGLGFVGALSGGCPYRMHVLAAEGKKSYWIYIIGFYAGLLFFDVVTAPLLGAIGELLK